MAHDFWAGRTRPYRSRAVDTSWKIRPRSEALSTPQDGVVGSRQQDDPHGSPVSSGPADWLALRWSIAIIGPCPAYAVSRHSRPRCSVLICAVLNCRMRSEPRLTAASVVRGSSSLRPNISCAPASDLSPLVLACLRLDLLPVWRPMALEPDGEFTAALGTSEHADTGSTNPDHWRRSRVRIQPMTCAGQKSMPLTLVVDAALRSGKPNAQLVAAEVLCRNSEHLDPCQSTHWPSRPACGT